MRRITNWKSLGLLLSILTFPSLISAQDIPNSQDHPVITRYPGHTIGRYDVKEFDQYNLVLSVDRTGAPENVRKLEGKVTRIYYRNPAGRSTLESPELRRSSVDAAITTSAAPFVIDRNVPSSCRCTVVMHFRAESNGSSATRGARTSSAA